MTHHISDAQLYKLLDEVRLADEDFHRAELAYKAAEVAKLRAGQAKAKAHNAARPHLRGANGPVIYDGYVWRLSTLHVTHERIGRDLSPRQETLLPEATPARA